MRIDSIYKNNKVYDIINNDIKNNRVNHAYFLHGQDQELVKAMSLAIASHISCKRELAPCNNCSTCQRIYNNTHSDLFIYPSQDKKTIQVKDSQEIVLQSYIVPLEAKYKVFILNNFENTTISAQNKLLKTLEEPSKSVVFIINSVEPKSVLATIKSRCKNVYVPNLDKSELEKVVVDNTQGMSKPKIKALLNFKIETLSDIKQVLQNNAEDGMDELVYEVFTKMINSSYVLEYSNKIITKDQSLKNFYNSVLATLLKVIKSHNNIVDNNDKDVDKIKTIKSMLSVPYLNTLYTSVINAINELSNNTNKTNSLENFLFKILEAKFKCQKSQI